MDTESTQTTEQTTPSPEVTVKKDDTKPLDPKVEANPSEKVHKSGDIVGCNYVSNARCFKTADGKKIVPEGDAEAHTLFLSRAGLIVESNQIEDIETGNLLTKINHVAE